MQSIIRTRKQAAKEREMLAGADKSAENTAEDTMQASGEPSPRQAMFSDSSTRTLAFGDDMQLRDRSTHAMFNHQRSSQDGPTGPERPYFGPSNIHPEMFNPGYYGAAAEYPPRDRSPRPHQFMRRYPQPSGPFPENAPSYKMNLPTFDGKKKWKTFIRQFEAISSGWSYGRKLQYMISSLQGDAADYAFQLDPSALEDYHALVEELERRFDIKETRQTKVRQFYSRRLRRGESIREYAAELKRLIREAYPSGISRRNLEEMMKKQFFDGLEDEDLRYFVDYLKTPETLDEAVNLVYEYDDYRNIQREQVPKRRSDADRSAGKQSFYKKKDDINSLSDRAKSGKVPEKSVKPPRQASPASKDAVPSEKSSRDDKDQLAEAMVNLSKMLQAYMTTNAEAKERKTVTCYNCKNEGHYANKCPEKKQTVRLLAEESDQEELSDEDEEPLN